MIAQVSIHVSVRQAMIKIIIKSSPSDLRGSPLLGSAPCISLGVITKPLLEHILSTTILILSSLPALTEE